MKKVIDSHNSIMIVKQRSHHHHYEDKVVVINVIKQKEIERHTKLSEEIIKIKIKSSIEENDTLRNIRNHIVRAVVKLGG